MTTKCKRGHDRPWQGVCPHCWKQDAPTRFAHYVQAIDGHELWTGSLKHGYGWFHVGGQEWVKAHRFAYEMRYGPVPEGMELGHTCEFKHCVLHVRPVTHLQNVREGRVIDPDDKTEEEE
jgi:hypothetical protein